MVLMPSCRNIMQYFILGLLASGALLSQARAQNTRGQTVRKTRIAVSRHAVSPAQLPPAPPKISYISGKLTVIADNSTLSDVLSAIQNVTGATIEGVTPTSTDRVFGKFGPASPREVCSALLAGSAYDFIIMESPDHPGSIQQIILAARSMEPADLPSSQTTGSANPPLTAADDTDDNQGMSETNTQITNQNQVQAAPEQQQVFPPPVQSSPPQDQQASQDQPAAQVQSSPQGQQPAVTPSHPQHWGVNYPQPPQTTQQNPH